MTFSISKKSILKALRFLGGGAALTLSGAMLALGPHPDPMLLTAFAGGISLASHLGLTRITSREEQVELVKLIRQHDNQLALAEVMIHFNCTAREAKKKVAVLEQEGVVLADVSSEGEIYYTFSSRYLA